MNLRQWARASVTLFGAAMLIIGCAKPEDKGGQAKNKGPQVAKKDTTHDDWWCEEHGIPEDECSKCSHKMEKAFKDKGDWCKEHKIAMSQCFVCNPKQWDVYAAKYRDKYGKEPPAPTENMPKKEE